VRSLAYYYRRGKELRRQRCAKAAAVAGQDSTDVVDRPDEAIVEGGDCDRVASCSSSATSGVSAEIRCDSVGFGRVDSSECLTHKRVGEAASLRATVGPARAASTVHVPVSRDEQEVVDAKRPPDKLPGEAGDDKAEATTPDGVRCGDVAWSRTGPVSVLTTVAQVRAALRDARETGVDDIVVWGRCSRGGRVGRVVHFDGELRARARAP